MHREEQSPIAGAISLQKVKQLQFALNSNMPNYSPPRTAGSGLPRMGSSNNITYGVPQADVKTTVQALELGDFSQTLSPA